MRECDLRDEERARGEDKVSADDGEDGGWEPVRPIGPVFIDECEEEGRAAGKERSSH